MNWHAMLLMAAILGGGVLVALLGVWLIDEKNVHPLLFVAGLFLVVILAAGVFAK